MRGLTALEVEILSPGAPGAGPYPAAVFDGLVSQGFATWAAGYFEATDAGRRALVCAAAVRRAL